MKFLGVVPLCDDVSMLGAEVKGKDNNEQLNNVI